MGADIAGGVSACDRRTDKHPGVCFSNPSRTGSGQIWQLYRGERRTSKGVK